ncbi:NAD(P)-dependent oxidoreductase [Mycolicibacterium bacteremicum]|uniref:6-phosphogluconate dehydrogenase n=1 Tax=Mycolicibacterium bacteremicum TaxID=564198 RepID=A0A1W9YYH2_MYCBA|nr:NAD(P)-dependent oxidoreductase [Mycolicibacterium bacteremicum]MCV7431359.1 NAD(P)-dependent oxidoreductase [Mycolicibacterium bacteremicum]ORA05128.1 6-phosphogluconate dehydrogenase [Mycolicibacterium bacteremicum]
MTRVGFIGTGRMGAPMVRRLAAAGHQVLALGRSDDKRRAIADLGATPVSEPAEVAAAAEVVVICVFTDEQVRTVATPPLLDAIPAGAALVVHTTGSPQTVETIAAAAPHVGVLDAPVSGGPHDIAAGRVTVFAGGSDTALARAHAVLSAYADPVVHVGSLGAGQKVKLVNNTLFAAQIGLLAEAARLADRLGVDEASLLRALPHGSGASRVLDNVVRAGSTAAFIGAVREFIGKDVTVVRNAVAELGADLGVLEPVVNLAVSHPAGQDYS